MKKALITVACVLALFAVGCTSPTQKIAAVSTERGMEHINNIVDDLSTQAKQYALDAGVAAVKQAVANQDEAAAVAAVEGSFNECNKIGWLQIEYEKAKSYLRLSQMYIWSQQGIFDVMYKGFEKAKAAADAANDKTE
jgi:hypothetical protein